MNIKTLFAVILIGTLPCFADVACTEYIVSSRQQAEALRDEQIVRGLGSVRFPCAVGLTPHVEYPTCQQWISPFRLNVLVGEHLDVYGLDIGLIGNFVTREFGGLQISGVFNDVGEACASVQIAGVLNNCHGVMKGLQVGVVNLAEKGTGCQVGAINYANNLHGLQIGVLNIIRASVCPTLPVLNFAF